MSSSSFWARQTAPHTTAAQVAFDLLFGIILPIVCLVFDPVLFRPLTSEPLSPHWITGYGTIGLAIVALSVWIAARRPSRLLCGALWGGFWVAAILGLMLAPLALLGTLLAGIGLLGFTPFLTAFVYGRNAIRSAAAAGERAGAPFGNLLLLCGAVGVLALPAGAEYLIRRETWKAAQQVASAEAATASAGARTLAKIGRFADPTLILAEFDRQTDLEAQRRLGESYERLTGQSIEAFRYAREFD